MSVPLKQIMASEFKRQVLPWYKLSTTKSLDSLADVLVDLGVASDHSHGIELAPSLIGRWMYDKIKNYIGYDGGQKTIIYEYLCIEEVKDGRRNLRFKIYREKEKEQC